MDVATLSVATDLYSCSQSCRLARRFVSHPEFAAFCLELQRFRGSLGDVSADQYWRTFLRRLTRYRFDLSAAPLPFDDPSVRADLLNESLTDHLRGCESIYPDFAAGARQLLARLSALSEARGNPLLACISDVLSVRNAPDAALLLKESRLIPAVENIVRHEPDLRRVAVVSPHQIAGDTWYQLLIVVGPPRWYPEYVFTAPRALEIVASYYGWIKDDWQPQAAFASARASRSHYGFVDEGVEIPLDADVVVGAQDVLPTINISEVRSRAFGNTPTEPSQEEVDARLLLLEGDLGVFMEIDETYRVLVIDLYGDETSRVKRIPVQDIRPGLFVLLRTEGGGDYIVPLADNILGSEARNARETQRNWKERLKNRVLTSSLANVSYRLQDLGSIRANESNVRNWMSHRSIRTQDYRDFLAIMRLIGMESTSEGTWKVMELIDRAHRRAGMHIRRMLLRTVLNADLGNMERHGQMMFELHDGDGGSFTAFRVIDIVPDTVTVAISHLGEPFELEEADL